MVKRKDNSISIFLIAIIFFIYLLNISHLFETILLVNSSVISFISKGFLGLLFAYNFFYLIQNKKNIILIFTATSLFLTFFLLSNDNIYLKSNAAYFITIILPLVMGIQGIKSNTVLFNKLLFISKIIGIFSFFTLAYLIFNKSLFQLLTANYSMGFAHITILATMFLTIDTIANFRLYKLLLSISSLALILLLGSRSVFISYFLFIFIKFIKYYFLSPESLYKGRFIKGFAFIFLCFYITSNFYFAAFEKIGNKLVDLNIKSRTISLFSSSKGLRHTSGRLESIGRFLTSIFEDPYRVKGYMADQKDFRGGAAHNFIVEMFYDFGVIFGSLPILLWIIFIFLSLKVIFSYKYYIASDIMLPFFAESIPLFLLHKDPLITVQTWFWLGFLFKCYKIRNGEPHSNAYFACNQ